jgi:glucan endo-1,6-beta-glucosidase
MCNLGRTEGSAAVNNIPLWYGEWSLVTNFGASDDFLRRWADAQKLTFRKAKGWFYWNWRTEENYDNGTPMARQWYV